VGFFVEHGHLIKSCETAEIMVVIFSDVVFFQDIWYTWPMSMMFSEKR